jgi:uncharacterized protein (TIGR04222 family)
MGALFAPLGMTGPEFLLFYGIVIGITVLVVRAIADQMDSGDPGSPPPVPENPDPLEIAFLRGGAREVTRTVVTNLIHRGYVEYEAGERLRQATQPNPAFLTELERDVYEAIGDGRGADQFSPGLRATVLRHCREYESRLHRRKLLAEEPDPSDRFKLWMGGALVIIGVGVFRLATSIARDKPNVAFLVAMGILGLVFIAVPRKHQRITARGRSYLAAVRERFGHLRTSTGDFIRQEESHHLMLAVGVFGTGVLHGTSLDSVRAVFPHAASGSAGGTAGVAGCGGCGGGCGGCGGCGCGGCG